ncbi:hypothetical protein PRZ48_003282 [Zasmidium cellare]|uniref:B-block binding subunit of TFIIIC domain-containing protein n=1 Tax=Zasmidium cellare TaxID=395010 RepID=A0ABR0EV91_ZASCE|nr:hypothetical protein PRZ48_003282 [Zasmidium cellare]
MAGFDELIKRLLDEIALAGTQGFSAHQFEKTVKNYYDDGNAEATTKENSSGDDLLFSNVPPVKKIPVDDELLVPILAWLCKHPDIKIDDGQESQSTSQALNAKLAGKRIFTSEERVWQAITGHGVDHRRLPQREFEILSIIAAHGPTGVLQPHVTKLTGQDKRSVPGRTDTLAEKGYIVKENVIGAGAKTSSLKLKRYANDQPVIPSRAPNPPPGTSSKKAASTTIIYYDAWFNTTMRLLKENNNILSIEDLRLHLTLNPTKYENKILRRSIKRLSESGCIRCIKATLHDADGNALLHPASGRPKKAPSIQLLREPTDFDRMKWAQGNSNNIKASGIPNDDELIDDMDTAAQADEAEDMEVEDDFDDLELLNERVPPQWIPDIPLVNLVYNLVEEAGPGGISTMELANRLTGPMWRRPLDQVMSLLTDVWQQSQPSHLRHLTIVRDTSVRGKLVHSQYKTYDNFEKAVEAGDATWEAVLGSEGTKGKERAKDPKPDLDEWGFPVIPLQELASNDDEDTTLQGRRNSTRGDVTSDEASEGAADVVENPTQVKPKRARRKKSVQKQAVVDDKKDDDAAEVDIGAQTASATRRKPPASVSRKTGKITGAKRGRPKKQRDDLSGPGVPLVKKREIPQYEYDEWEAAVERMAQLKVMFEMRTAKGSNTTHADVDEAVNAAPVTLENLPQARLEQAREDLMARDKPGIYINPPGARDKKRANFVSRGRPRKALIAVVKTQSLHELEWFHDARTPQSAPTPKRKRTANIGAMPAEALSPEFVDSDSDLDGDEAASKRQRLDASTQPDTVPVVSADVTASTVGAELSDGAAAPFFYTTLPATAASLAPPADSPETLPTSLFQRNNKTQKQRKKEPAPASADVDTPDSAEANQHSISNTAAIEPQTDITSRARASALHQSLQSLPELTRQQNPSISAVTSAVTAVTGPTSRTRSAAEELNVLKSKRGRKTKETNARIAELEKQILEGRSDAVKEYKALSSRPGRKSRETITFLAELQKQIDQQQGNQTTAQRVNGAAAKLSSNAYDPAVATDGTQPEPKKTTSTQTPLPTINPQPPGKPPGRPDQTEGGNFTATNTQLFETFNKEYVLAHPTEVFHHRGFGRYARGPKPLKGAFILQAPGNVSNEVVKGSVQTERQIPAVTGEVAPQNRQPDSLNIPSPDGQEQTATSVPDKENRSNEEAADSGRAQSFGVQEIGSSATEDSKRLEQAATLVQGLDDSGEEREAEPPTLSSGTPKALPSASFDTKYVEAHPEQTFYHRGKGVWALGLPPPGQKGKLGVRGPGAEEWRASKGMPAKPPKTPAPSKKGAPPTEAARKSARKEQETRDEVGAGETARRGLVVRLPIPRPHLTALTSSENEQAKGERSTRKRRNPAPLPTPQQSSSNEPYDNIERSTSDDSNRVQKKARTTHATDFAQASTSSSPSILRIVRPYDATVRPQTTQGEITHLNPTTSIREPERISPAFEIKDQSEGTGPDNCVPAVDDPMEIDNQVEEKGNLSITPAAPVQLTTSPPKMVKRAGTARTGGNVVFQRQKIILDALRACDGVFPGDVEMWYVFVHAWKRKHNQTPNKLTVDNALKTLQQMKQIKKLLFQFHGLSGNVVQRTMFTEPNIDPNSLQVKKMQKKIIDCYPSYYVPDEVEVGAEVRDRIVQALGKRQNAQADGDEGIPTSTPTKRKSAAVREEPVIVRQTQRATDVEIEQAKQQGFPDVLAYRQHLLDIAKAKRSGSSAQYQAQRCDEETASNGQAVVQKGPPKPIPALHRKPLGSLRPNTRPKNRPPRPRDVGGGMTLEDETRHRLRAAYLIHHPPQAFHEASGTFNTCPVVLARENMDMRFLRNRPVILDDYKQNPLLKASSNVPFELVEILGRECSSHLADKAHEFFQEIDAVEAWEQQQQEEPADITTSKGVVFINHTLHQPHVRVDTAQDALTTTVPALTAPATTSAQQASLGAQTLITQEMSRKTGKGKRQYVSRKNKSVNFDHEVEDSDTEFVPDGGLPTRRTAGVRTDGKEIASRDRKSGAEFKDVKRLITAVALVTTLCGGLHSDRPPWTAVAHAMGFHHDGEFYRRRWDGFKRYRREELDNLRSRIREELPTAYERDELPPIDFQDLRNTDWPALLEWVEESIMPNVDTTQHLQAPELLQSRAAIEDQFVVQEQAPVFQFGADEYFTNLTETGRKHFALRYTHGIPLVTEGKDAADDMVVLKSWVRSVIMTKQWNYNADVAAAKLSTSFPTPMLEKVTAEMVEGRMFAQERKGRQLPGRNFVIHNDVLVQFKRWPAKPDEYQYLRIVANTWSNIVRHFNTNDELKLVAEASDPEYLVLTNMVAQGQIKSIAMLPPRKDEYDASFPKLSPWGYSGYSYETKKVNPSMLKAPVVYKKSPSYQARHGLTGKVPIPLQPAMREGEAGLRIPFWVDIHGNLIDDVWDMVVRSLMHLLVFRPGSTATRLEECHGHKFWDWEIELALAWMEKTGIAVRCGEGVEKDGIWKGGWSAGEWWYCAFAPDVAIWKAPSGAEIGIQTAA